MLKPRLTSLLFKSGQNNKLVNICVAGLVVFIGAAVIPFIRISIDQKDTTKTVNPFRVSAVRALGRIEPQTMVIKLTLAQDLDKAKISQLSVTEGDKVVKGQTIALLDNYQSTNAAVKLARQKVKIAQANLANVKAGLKGNISTNAVYLKQVKAQLEEEISANEAEVARLKTQLIAEQAERQAVIDRLRIKLRNTKSKFKQYPQLAQEEVIFESESSFGRLTTNKIQNSLLKAQSDYNFTTFTLQKQINRVQGIISQRKNTLQEQIIKIEAILNSVEKVNEVDLIKAQARVNKAIAILSQTEQDLRLSSVKAPTDGQITRIYAYPGEIVDDNGVVELVQNSSMIVVAEVHESDIGNIKKGQSATFRSEIGAFTGEITGKVSHISSLKIGQRDTLNIAPADNIDSKVFQVKIHLDPQTSARLAHLANSEVIVEIN
ncbi:MAG: HlyD family efflux transporter periplasmic adaptor subunit [Cyanobacteria bacterium P01_A01_bin.83]